MSPNNSKNWHKNKRHPVTKVHRRVRLIKLKLLRINDPPERIARGAALGVVCGILPTFGFGGFIAFGLAFVFKANKAAAILGSFIMNPVTTPFFWTFSLMLGSLILGADHTILLEKIETEGLVAGFSSAYIVFLVGNSIIATFFCYFTYKLIKNGIRAHRKIRDERKARNGRRNRLKEIRTEKAEKSRPDG
ncbi:MAG: DUF2062 domain-containing protein [Proteobacteria bacterium]|nr:DUF2062 domain-containing protein [Pseudomonadota bacterium]